MCQTAHEDAWIVTSAPTASAKTTFPLRYHFVPKKPKINYRALSFLVFLPVAPHLLK